jgi:large subunit ribosomal protein L4
MLKKVTDIKLPKEYNIKPNLRLLAQAGRVYEERGHVGLRKAKTRAEINKTGKKLYKQKGTGGARHGSKRAPIFVGGGVAHGPRPIRKILTLPSKLKSLSKAMALSLKNSAKEVVVVQGVGTIQKTKEASEFVKKLEGNRFTFLFSEKNKGAIKKVKNLKNTQTILFRNANAWVILNGGVLILDKDIFSTK